ncbi:MAG TPA: tRNA guanosine(34) transglycosylase Tgt [Anaerolineaceae bacterium]|nr:tRNA guanosine(34) transglycosylase Tgt [Anaerolineaceae bacterium]
MDKTFPTSHGVIPLPAFLPDATFGQVRGLDTQDLIASGVQAVMMNSYHLMQKPGTTVVSALGELHAFSGWQGPIFTDSGGFQAYSLIRQNSSFGSFSDDGILLKDAASGKKTALTPEKSMQIQWKMGADVLFCLDDCTHVDDADNEQVLSVQRTVHWAKRCKQEFLHLLENSKKDADHQRKLFAVVQGGGSHQYREACAKQLLEIGFDGYGYGGWPLDKDGNLVEDIVGYTRELIPAQFPMHALGIGHPYNLMKTFRLGYQLFDCAMPTRDARHGRLYRLRGEINPDQLNWLEYVYAQDERHIRQKQPIDPSCNCPTCQHYSLGYIRHLHQIGESLYTRLATIHNLYFMARVIRYLRGESA